MGGYCRENTTKSGMKRCIQQIFPEDIINLILKWNNKQFYIDRKPYWWEIRIYVHYNQDRSIPYYIEPYWSVKKIIKHILEENGKNSNLYEKVKLTKSFYFNQYYYKWGEMELFKRAEEKIYPNDHFFCTIY